MLKVIGLTLRLSLMEYNANVGYTIFYFIDHVNKFNELLKELNIKE